ncbi:cleavage and polyadenylation specificity factor, putative [Entamoeba invadens IP1]|uniref:cleavage and polyadenylation specificity factor, putative n=1 Tax=Entamoeba invadens IP1 TaxID=370355 RepID=UPI0002C3CFF4|nr:cleavage and polyadenylation specificity factor, putative [Entamoeba invadens IP1]ELP93800.1 cleavage and polyadenylation specificity factor, putative [Entamoeba invadens IP1]|eukprot:XP_004260571.1 cleavage and polyadenylation specificity factor, putative [Entamoeba invadens IP1]
MKLHVFGGGQSVGCSCFVVEGREDAVVLDCGYNHVRSDIGIDFEKMNLLAPKIRCCCITHYHVDHVGMLPWLCKFLSIPIFMAQPTLSVLPMILSDTHSSSSFILPSDIEKCVNQCSVIQPGQSIRITKNVSLRCFYAGHALGAVCFEILFDGKTIVYTGDIDNQESFLIRSAEITPHSINYLISESTCIYERIKKRFDIERYERPIVDTIQAGGSVQIISNSAGRGQEIFGILYHIIEKYKFDIPVCGSGGVLTNLAQKYAEWKTWLRPEITTEVSKFREIELLSHQTQFIVVTTPANLGQGQSKEVFERIRASENNLLILPSYVTFNKKDLTPKLRKCKVVQIEENNHYDGNGIQSLIRALTPNEVVLVHGDEEKMKKAKVFFEQLFRMPFYLPANGDVVTLGLAPSQSKKSTQSSKRCEPKLPPSEKEYLHDIGNKAPHKGSYNTRNTNTPSRGLPITKAKTLEPL